MWSNCLLDLATDFLVGTWSLYEIHDILRKHFISMAHVLCSSAMRVHDSQAYRKMAVTGECIRCILELREMAPVVPDWFQLC